MATAYAHAVRARALLLPWDMVFGSKLQYEQCPAATVCWQLLRPVNQFPEEHWNRSYKEACCRLCFFCKQRLEISVLAATCSCCADRFASLDKRRSQQYFHVYTSTLELAHSKWTIPTSAVTNQTPSLDWTSCYSIAAVQADQLAAIGSNPALSALEKLKLSARIRLRKL